MENTQGKLEHAAKANQIADEIVSNYEPIEQGEMIAIIRTRIMDHLQKCIDTNKQLISDIKKLR